VTPGEFERLRSFTLEIAETITGAKGRDEGAEVRFPQGLSIRKSDGAWYSFTAGKGGFDAVGLIAFLTKGSPAEALAWAEKWLATHPGTGGCGGSSDEEYHLAGKEMAERILAESVALAPEQPAWKYLESRRLEPPFPGDLRFRPYARCGECSLVAILRSQGRIAGVLEAYLDPDGRKSSVEPVRRRFMLEKAADAVFEIPSPGENKEVITCEGVENALATYRFGKRRCRIIGMPGIHILRRLKFPPGTRVTIFRDSDPDGSPAAKALQAGIDDLILDSGAEILATPNDPDGYDANRVLTERGTEGVARVLDAAEPAILSLDGKIEELARLDKLEYERVRVQKAKEFGIRVGVLDEKVDQTQARMRAAAHRNSGPDWADIEDEEVDLCDILDGILTQAKRYIVTSDNLLGTAALWCAFTYLVHHEWIQVWVAPRLAIQAKTHGCGKTALLEILANLVFNPRPSSSITASTLLRMVGTIKPTLLIDEAQRVLRRDRSDELVAICNASHRRTFAYVERAVPTPDGGWVVERFDVWCTMAMAGIGELPPEQQDRSIVIRLDKALAEDVPAQLEDGTSPELAELQRKLDIWSRTISSLDRPERPEVLKHQPGRVFDNWRPLIAIADLAGSRWPQLVQDAIAEAIGVERQLSQVERLLLSIRKAFQQRTLILDATGKVVKGSPPDRLETSGLVAMLNEDSEEDWKQENHGRGITEYWLRDRLRGLLQPTKSQSWETQKPRTKHKGYLRSQFEHAWKTHLAGLNDDDADSAGDHTHNTTGSGVSGVSGASGESGQNQQDDRVGDRVYPGGVSGGEPEVSGSPTLPDTPDGRPDGAANYPARSATSPDSSDSPDDLEGEVHGYSGESPPTSIEGEAKRLAAEHPTWSCKRIAKALGQPEKRIAQYLPDLVQPLQYGARSLQPADEARALLDHWVRERWAILQRRMAGSPPPWTTDPILACHRFCNVRRSDDATTLWINRHISEACAADDHLWLMLCATRIINWPPTLLEMMSGPHTWPGPDFDPDAVATLLQNRLDSGEKTFSNAYGRGTLKSPRYIASMLSAQLGNHAGMLKLLRQPGTTLAAVHTELSRFKGWSGDGFLSYQVAVDLRFSLLWDAPDRETWAAAGPGTLRGVNRMLGRPLDPPPSQPEALDYIRKLYAELGNDFKHIDLDLSDVCNILCETDKYLRVHNNEPGAKLRRYTYQPDAGNGAGNADPEIARVVEILREIGPGGETTSALYHRHHVYGGTLEKAKDLGLILNGSGNRWRLQ
jgi:hypothetical protein